MAMLKTKYSAPTADFTATPTSVDRGQEVTFTDASTGATGWEWDFDNNGVVDGTRTESDLFLYHCRHENREAYRHWPDRDSY